MWGIGPRSITRVWAWVKGMEIMGGLQEGLLGGGQADPKEERGPGVAGGRPRAPA